MKAYKIAPRKCASGEAQPKRPLVLRTHFMSTGDSDVEGKGTERRMRC